MDVKGVLSTDTGKRVRAPRPASITNLSGQICEILRNS